MVCLLATAAMAQDMQEHHFVKIDYSAGETVAVDSSGQEWIYDSEQGEFVPRDEYDSGSGLSDEGENQDYGPDDIVLPPEIRCTDIYDGDITEIFSEVVVELDERIEGSVTSGKDITIKGLVIGNVFGYRTVTIEGTGEVRGDVIAREIIRERGGRILGQYTEVAFPQTLGIGIPKVTGFFPNFMGIIFTAFLMFLCIISIALFPNHLARIVARIEREVIKTFFWGILAWFSIIPIFVLLVITIIGIPVALLIFPFALIAAFLLGYIATTIYIGKMLAPIFGWQEKSIYIKSIIGVLAIAVLRLLANFSSAIGAGGLDLFFAIIYLVVVFAVITIGLGAVASTRFGTRPKPAGTAPEPSPTPPEPRPAPPIQPPPPPQSDPVIPQVIAPPPPVPPPSPRSGNATDEGKNPSNK